jgi:hypothetical protein
MSDLLKRLTSGLPRSSEIVEYLRGFGCTSEKLPGSPNTLFRWLPG